MGGVIERKEREKKGPNRMLCFFFFSSRRRHTRFDCDWSSDVCSSDLYNWEDESDSVRPAQEEVKRSSPGTKFINRYATPNEVVSRAAGLEGVAGALIADRKSTRLNSSHSQISYAVFCLKKKKLSSLTGPQKPDARTSAYFYECLNPSDRDVVHNPHPTSGRGTAV